MRFPAIVDSVVPTAEFTEGKLLKGDRIIGFNNTPVGYYNEFTELKSKFKGRNAVITVLRGADTIQVKSRLSETGMVGFSPLSPASMFTTVTEKYSLLESIPKGIEMCFQTLDRYISGLKLIFAGTVSAKDSLGSVISIGNTFPGVWDWERFWTLTAVFSIILAFMNILPIPALDGGHALFCIYEMITGHKPSDKFMEYAQMAGMILLFALMAYALGLDIFRLFN